MTFGGGLVGGDVIHIDFHIGNQSAALVTSQESAKVSGYGRPVVPVVVHVTYN